MPKKLRLSVVVPAHNEAEYIETTIKALLAQSVPIDEIIVVDNNSTDDTAKIVKSFSQVKLIKEQQQGLPYARNAGLNAATGDIFGRIDADTIVDKDWSKVAKKFMGEHKDVIGISGPTRFYDLIFTGAYSSIFNFCSNRLMRVVAGTPLMWGSCMVMRREGWEKIKTEVNNDDTKTWEDLDLTMRIKKYGRIEYVKALKTRTSARSGKTNAVGILRYNARWPRTLGQFSRWKMIKAYVAIGVLFVFFIIPIQLTVHFPNDERPTIK